MKSRGASFCRPRFGVPYAENAPPAPRVLPYVALFVLFAIAFVGALLMPADGRISQLGTPDEVYRRPADRFVASFVGDVNVLRARLERRDGVTAIVALAAARVKVPGGPLDSAASGAAVDLFVRPEDLRVADDGTAAIAHGVVAAQVYQGGHVDLHVDSPEVASTRVLLRIPGQAAITRWPIGTRVGIALATEEAVAFPIAQQKIPSS